MRSYRTAAQTVASFPVPLSRVLASKGMEGLTELQGIGDKLAGLIREYIETGTVEALTSLEQEVPAGKLKGLARESGAHTFEHPVDLPLPLLLAIDEEYREKAAAGKLKKIAPRLMNPEKRAWLPILATERNGYKFTVMFSNTERAHELGKTGDWVVIYAEKGKGESQCTVVTEQRGTLKGKRVIRGRERDCEAYYARGRAAT